MPPYPTVAVLRANIRDYFDRRFREADVVIERVWLTSPERCYVQLRKIGVRSFVSSRPSFPAHAVQVVYDIHTGMGGEIMEV